MTYANQIDARIQLNDATLDAWWVAMEHVDFDAAKWGITDYYAKANPNGTHGVQVLLPAALKHRVNAEVERRAARKRALAPKPVKSPTQTFRARNPELWDRLVEEGRQAHLAYLEQRGRLGPRPGFSRDKPSHADLSQPRED